MKYNTKYVFAGFSVDIINKATATDSKAVKIVVNYLIW